LLRYAPVLLTASLFASMVLLRAAWWRLPRKGGVYRTGLTAAYTVVSYVDVDRQRAARDCSEWR
jgi:predicted membrane metal-binding protein